MTLITLIRNRYQVDANPERSERRLELAVIALLLVVLLQILWWMFGRFSEATVTAVEPAKDSLRVADATVTGAITAPQSLQLQSRPLFWASRRPNAKAAPPQKAAPGNGKPARRLEDLKVAGAVGAGDQGKAIIIHKDKLMRLGIGDTVAGWSLQSVSLGEVVFVSAGARDVRRLTPLPVIAAQKAPAADSQASTAAAAATPKAAASKQASAAKSPPPKNNKKEATLSLGG
ncbi:hypothetical protein R0135_16840 [Congregibacter variabilis]|uniref:Type II secretion system protein GspC N-terminal domain-containing protein n=1 Tax=Congregibacter variabilis TaxID=3081200 RepID=A0ABZ0I2Q9_9GAMM|nr:hypothetical protein R0135_16840 [Congregibacter sp. IMCC43200]